eukprot:m.17608 g.17608  ORF g.17608 m.17608 type:complete len:475 (-) comp8321_c0_seq2:141-1565(-)
MDPRAAVQAILEAAETKPAVVKKVRVSGLARTRDWVVRANLAPLFEASTLQQVLENAQEVSGRLQGLGVFSKIEAKIDVDPELRNGYIVDYELKESRLLTGKTGVQIGNNEGSADLQVSINNVFGCADRLVISSARSTQHGTAFNVQHTVPVMAAFWQPLTIRYSHDNLSTPTTGLEQHNRRIAVDQSFLSSLGTHKITLESKWLNVKPSLQEPPFELREASGHFLNNSISHEMMCDFRAGTTHGLVMRQLTRLSGGYLGGSFSYLKNNVEFDYTTRRMRRFGGIHFRFSARAGLVAPTLQLTTGLHELLQGVPSQARSGPVSATQPSSAYTSGALQSSAICVSDRFLLGGPTDIRGFRLHSVGPQRRGYAVGASAYWAAAAHVYSPLPHGPWRERFGDLLRLHGFVTAGSATSEPTFNAMQHQLTTSLAVSCGLGLSLDFQAASLELNYCVPLVSSTGIASPGFSFAIGTNLL